MWVFVASGWWLVESFGRNALQKESRVGPVAPVFNEKLASSKMEVAGRFVACDAVPIKLLRPTEAHKHKQFGTRPMSKINRSIMLFSIPFVLVTCWVCWLAFSRKSLDLQSQLHKL